MKLHQSLLSRLSRRPQPTLQEVCDTFDAIARIPATINVKAEEPRREVSAAITIAVQAHAGQIRKDGSPVVSHPKRVAQILLLTGAGFDEEVLCAGILHDVIEDGPNPDGHRLDISKMCGQRVLNLVDAVTKPACGHSRKHCILCETSFVMQILIASVANVAPIQIKLADVADNLATLGGLSPEAARRYVRISRLYLAFAWVRLGVTNSSYRFCAAQLREAESQVKKSI